MSSAAMDLAMELTNDVHTSMNQVATPIASTGGPPMVPSFYQGPVLQQHHHHVGGDSSAAKAMRQLMTSGGNGASGNGLKGGNVVAQEALQQQQKTSDQVATDQAREILRQAVVSGMGGEKQQQQQQQQQQLVVMGAPVVGKPVGENGKGKTTTTTGVVRYRECQKNHAAGIGGHALDGCGEFIPTAADHPEGGLRCAACECHRNFHRREIEGEPASCECMTSKARKIPAAGKTTTFSPGAALVQGPALPLAMAAALSGDSDDDVGDDRLNVLQQQQAPQHLSASALKKRFRTKFSTDQKDQMCAFAEKLGWRIQKHDEAAVQEFCATVGVKRHVLKVWMHNNKHTMGKKP